MLLQLIDQKGYKRFLLYAVPIVSYCLASFAINRLMVSRISLVSVLGFEVFFISVCYGFSRWLDLLFLPEWKYRSVLILMLFCFTTSILAYYWVYYLMPWGHISIVRPNAVFHRKQFLQHCMMGLFRAFIYGVVYYLLKEVKKEAKAHISELEKRLATEQYAARQELEKKAFQTALLTAQIYPHFARNAFTTIVGMAVDRKNESLVEVVLKLSALMGYLSEQGKTMDRVVPLAEELKFMDRLLEILCLQQGGQQVVQKTERGNPKPLTIPPLLLLTLVENAVKYGAITVEYPLKIKLDYGEQGFVFRCWNRKKKDLMGVESTQMGLRNITHRLELLMPGRYQLRTMDNMDSFLVTLTIYYA